MPNNNYCSALGCTRRNRPGVMFHRFPRDKTLCKIWIDHCCSTEFLKDLERIHLLDRRLCSAHFDESDYYVRRDGTKRLKKRSFPRKNPDCQTNSFKSISTAVRGNNNFVLLDHDYCVEGGKEGSEAHHISDPKRDVMCENSSLDEKKRKRDYSEPSCSKKLKFSVDVMSSEDVNDFCVESVEGGSEAHHISDPKRDVMCENSSLDEKKRKRDYSKPSCSKKLRFTGDAKTSKDINEDRLPSVDDYFQDLVDIRTIENNEEKMKIKASLKIVSKSRKFLSKQKITKKKFGFDNNTTPNKRKLFRLSQTLKSALAREKSKNTLLARQLKHYVLNPIETLENNDRVSPLLLNLLKGNLRNKNRSTKGRRWTEEEKTLAVSIFKKSPRCYNFLRQLMCLPTKRTLISHMNKIPFEVGINQQIFDHLKSISSKMHPLDRKCTLTFDEIGIKALLCLNEHKDRIEGYEDFGSLGRTNRVADHALVFMLQGIRKKWMMPIAYYFTKGTVPTYILKALIKEIIAAVESTGLSVVATICDQGATNRAALNSLIKDRAPERQTDPYFEVNGNRINIIFDPPHLLKNTRNNFMTHDLLLDGKSKIAKWEYVQKFYTRDKGISNMAHKLSDCHMNPVGRAKMKVKFAAQVFSHTVAAGMNTLIKTKRLDQEAAYTAQFIKDMDNLFDSFNGSTAHPKDGKVYRTSLSENSEHYELWNRMLKTIENMKFIDGSSKKVSRPPSQDGWLTTIRSVKDLYERLKPAGLKYLNMRNLNQDALENLFSKIRQHGAFNTNPVTTQFTAALKTCIINSMSSKSTSSNCEDDGGELLSHLNEFFSTSQEHSTSSKEDNDIASENQNCNKIPIVEKFENRLVEHYSFERQSYAYVCGYIVKRLFGKKDICIDCRSVLTTEDFTSDHIFTSFKEYREQTTCLYYPSRDMTNSVISCVKIIYEGQPTEILEQSFFQANLIRDKSQVMLDTVDWDWLTCGRHKQDVVNPIVKMTCRIFFKSWCRKYKQAMIAFDFARREKARLKKKEASNATEKPKTSSN